MATVKLGTRPKTFKQTIMVPLHEGGEGTMKVDFVYRTREEHGVFIDSLLAEAEVKLAGETPDDVRYSLEQAMKKTVSKNAEYLMQIMAGWNLDEEFSLAALRQLCNELPGAAAAIMRRYDAAITEGRLGN